MIVKEAPEGVNDFAGLRFGDPKEKEKPMRVVVQRVLEASVAVDEEMVGQIGRGLLLYLAVKDGDGPADTEYLVDKVLGLRIFEDDSGKMNLSLKEVGGALLIVSQFTLYGDCRRGRRPSFSMAAPPEAANRLYQSFVERCRQHRITVQTGVFRETMRIRSTNDGPVTLLLDSSKSF